MNTNPDAHNSFRQKPPATKLKILVIDDDLVIAELLRDYLGGEKGYLVLKAHSGVEGIKAAIEHVPNLILLDFQLGDMTGLEVHERLREEPVTKDIPVIYVSSFLALRTIEQATVKGAKGFINKPFNLSEMYTKVASVLGST